MKSSWDTPPPVRPKPPAFDRRALERFAVGAPPPAPPSPIRAIERGARVSSGWPLRSLDDPSSRRRPLLPVAPEISIGTPRPRARPAEDLSFEPLYILVPGDESGTSGLAGAAALTAADRFLGGRPVYLIDLDPSGSGLAALVGQRDEEGLSDALAFGLSLDATGFLLENGVRFIPAGALTGKPSSLYDHPSWSKILGAARRRGARLLAYAPVDEDFRRLASHAGAALLLATPEEEVRLRARLPESLPIVGAIEPPAAMPLPQPRVVALPRPVIPRAVETPVLSPSGAVPPPAEPVVYPPPTAGTFEGVLRTLSEELEPSNDQVPGALQPEPVVAERAEGLHGSTVAAPSPPSAVVEPPMQAPTARGLTLGEWLASEEKRIRVLQKSPGHALVLPESVEPATRRSPAPEPLPPIEEELEEGSRAVARETSVEAAAPPADEVVLSPPSDVDLDADFASVRPSSAPPSPRRPSMLTEVEQIDALAADITPYGTSRYSVPRTSPGRERLIRVTAVLILAYWTYYIIWRWTNTLNFDALWFSLPLALAETWGWVTAFFLVFSVWRLNHREVPPAPDGVEVDVFITTYDEPLEVIRRTTLSAREIRYPHRTFVLDDGRREEIRSMAEQLGVGYITRDNNEHAKAGNLNNALGVTSGEFVLLLDADHAPLPTILDRLLGFFGDQKVALVQTPQDFYNIDSFTSDVDEDTQRIWEEQKLFFSVIQPGKDSWNSAFFCGSCAVVRRRALVEMGGFSVKSITEDIETSMLLHSRGWTSVYHGESLAYGLAANSATAFQIQHGRWAQGAMQVLRAYNPLTLPGLTIAQRIGYFYSLSAYVVGLQKLIFYAAPVVFFFTGALPIRALDNEFLVRFVPYLILSILLVEMLSRGLGFTWIAERYQMAKFWTYTWALPTYLTNQRLRFRVTPKGRGDVQFSTYAPHLGLMVITVIAVYWATFAFERGWVNYSVDGWSSLAFQLNFVWATIDFILAAYVVRLSLRLQQHRQDHRFSDRFPIHLSPIGADGRLGDRQLALTENLNAGGVSFRSVTRFEPGTELKITLPLSTSEVVVAGIVVHVREEQHPGIPAHLHGVEFQDIALPVRDAIEIHCTHHAVPFKQMQYRAEGKVFSSRTGRTREQREPRRLVRLPTWVLLGEFDGDQERRQNVAFLEEVGPGGASVIMNEAVPPGTTIIFEVPGTNIRGEGRTTYSRPLETPIGVRFLVGIRTQGDSSLAPEPRSWVSRAMRSSRSRMIFLALLGAASLAPASAAAQLVVYGGAEVDSRDQSLLLIGAAVHSLDPGWSPYAGVLAYRLNYLAEDGTVTVDALAPSIGVRTVTSSGVLQVGLGYLFLASEAANALGAPAGTGEGVLLSGLAEQRTPQVIAQLSGSYNLGDRYLWIRGRGSKPLRIRLPAGPLSLGGEVIFQGGGSGEGYHSFQAAPTIELPVTPVFRLLAGAGWKSDDLPQTRGGGFPYGRIEFTYVPE